MEKIAFELQVDGTGAVSATKALKAQLKEATNEAQILAQKFGNASKEAIDAAKRAAKIKDEIAGVNEAINALHPEDKFNAVTQAVNGIAGGFAAAEGAMALFGAESEDVQKQMLKVQAALALSQGLNQITELKGGFEALSIQVKATTIYQAAYNFVQTGTTIGARLLRLAMLALPFVAIATGLTLLYLNFDKVKKIMTENIDTIIKIAEFMYRFMTPIGLIQTGIEKLGEKFVWVQNIIDATVAVITKVKDSIIGLLEYVNILDTAEEDAAQASAERSKEKLDQSDKLLKARQREIELAKLQGATEDDIRAKEIMLLDEQLDAYLNYVNAKKKANEKVTEDELEELAIRQQAYKVAILEDSNADKKEQEDKLKALQEKNRKLAEERKKANDERLKKIAQEEQAATDALIKAEEERQAKMKQYMLDVNARRDELDKAEREKTYQGRREQIEIDLQRELELLTGADNATQALKLQLKQNANLALLEEDRKFAEAQAAIEKEKTDKEKEEQEKRRAAQDAYGSSVLSGFKTLGANLEANNKKATAIAKAAAIADLGVQTGKAIANDIQIGTAFGASLGPAGLVATPIAISSLIGLTLTNFAFAAKKIGAPAPSGAPSGSIGAPAPVATVTSTRPSTDTGALRAEANAPIRAVVVETDLTRTQRRVSSIEERATF
jgi:hypothetical protein